MVSDTLPWLVCMCRHGRVHLLYCACACACVWRVCVPYMDCRSSWTTGNRSSRFEASQCAWELHAGMILCNHFTFDSGTGASLQELHVVFPRLVDCFVSKSRSWCLLGDVVVSRASWLTWGCQESWTLMGGQVEVGWCHLRLPQWRPCLGSLIAAKT